MAEFIHNRQVQFAETDMGGIVHFSSFFRYMEEAEHQFLQSLGLSVVMYLEGKKIGMPRVSAKCDFHHPARFQDTLQIFVKLQRLGTSSLSYTIDIKKVISFWPRAILLRSFANLMINYPQNPSPFHKLCGIF